MSSPSRRRYLRGTATLVLAGVAGCVESSGPAGTATGSGTPENPTDAPAGTGTPTTTAPPNGTQGGSETPTDDTGTGSATPDPGTDTDAPHDAVVWQTAVDSSFSTDPVVESSWGYTGTQRGVVRRHFLEEGSIGWAFGAGRPIQDVVAADGTVLAVAGTHELGASHDLVALAAGSGTRRWSFAPTDWWLEVVAVGDGVAYVSTADDALGPSGQTLYALSLSDGSTRWSGEVGDPREAVLGDETVVLSSFDRTYAFDRASGEPLWDRAVHEEVYTTLGAVDGTVVYAYQDPESDAYSVFVGVDESSGIERWRFDDFAVTSAVVRDGTVYVGGGGLAAVDPGDGSTVWSVDAGGYLTDESVTSDRIYAGGDPVRAYARDGGTVEWTWTPDPAQGGVTAAGSDDGSVFFDAYHDAEPRNQYKFLVDASNGTQRWSFEAGTELRDLAVSEREGVALAGGANGELYGLA